MDGQEVRADGVIMLLLGVGWGGRDAIFNLHSSPGAFLLFALRATDNTSQGVYPHKSIHNQQFRLATSAVSGDGAQAANDGLH